MDIDKDRRSVSRLAVEINDTGGRQRVDSGGMENGSG